MKKEHEKIIEKMSEDIRQIPGFITGTGAQSATLESYISAAKDLQEAHEHEVIILDSIFTSEQYSKLLRRRDVDRDEIQTTIDICEEKILKHSNELHKFIEFRKSKNWK